jgi:AcrR family transcriptional regulator
MATRKLTKRGTKRRDQVMDVALRLFAEQGYHGTTVGDVCDTLGVGKGVFYWYFESKEALFTELLQECLLKLRRAQQYEIEKVAQPVGRIEQGIRASIDFFRETPAFLSVIRGAARYEEFSTFVTQGQEIVVADVAVHVKEGQAQGTIRHGDPYLMAHGFSLRRDLLRNRHRGNRRPASARRRGRGVLSPRSSDGVSPLIGSYYPRVVRHPWKSRAHETRRRSLWAGKICRDLNSFRRVPSSWPRP